MADLDDRNRTSPNFELQTDDSLDASIAAPSKDVVQQMDLGQVATASNQLLHKSPLTEVASHPTKLGNKSLQQAVEASKSPVTSLSDGQGRRINPHRWQAGCGDLRCNSPLKAGWRKRSSSCVKVAEPLLPRGTPCSRERSSTLSLGLPSRSDCTPPSGPHPSHECSPPLSMVLEETTLSAPNDNTNQLSTQTAATSRSAVPRANTSPLNQQALAANPTSPINAAGPISQAPVLIQPRTSTPRRSHRSRKKTDKYSP